MKINFNGGWGCKLSGLSYLQTSKNMNPIKSFIALAICPILFAACEDKAAAPVLETSAKAFTYQTTMGKCVDNNGKVGYNAMDLATIRSTKDCECMDLSGQNLVYLLDVDKIEDFNELGDNRLLGYNFKGANFDGAELFFNRILEADFRGADLRKIQFGYAYLKGEIDAFTKLPEEGICESSQHMLNCSR